MQTIFLTFLAVPLSFVGIPIYINIGDFYARKFGISLITIGLVLAVVRLIDSIQDPLIGKISDNLAQKNVSKRITITFFGLLLCVFFYLVFNPPTNLGQNLSVLWFLVNLSATYFCFNFIFINFESIIALNSNNDQERVNLNSWKEFFGIVGMILAFIIPVIFAKNYKSEEVYQKFAIFFSLLLVIGLIFLSKSKFLEPNFTKNKRIKFRDILSDKSFLTFIKIFFFNSLAISLPAANLNFYVKDVLKSGESLGLFLSTYFISACIFIPLWRFIAGKINVVKSWSLSLVGSCLVFFFAYFIESDSANLFYLICFLSGIFLGADLVYPPVIMAKITSNNNDSVSSYFAFWNFVTKIAIMIAASLSSVALGFLGYQPSIASSKIDYIPIFYAVLPCLIKLYVLTLLLRLKKDKLSLDNL